MTTLRTRLAAWLRVYAEALDPHRSVDPTQVLNHDIGNIEFVESPAPRTPLQRKRKVPPKAAK